MTKETLRSLVKEAKEKEQIGLIIYTSWSMYGQFSNERNPFYNEAVKKILNNKNYYYSVTSYDNPISKPGFTAVPLDWLADEEYLKMFLDTCNSYYQPVIITVPNNEIV